MIRNVVDNEQTVNPEAGFELLTYFQDRWHQMHKNSEICSKKAQTAFQRLDRLDLSSSKLSTSIQLLLVGYQSLSHLDERIEEINNEIEGLFGYFKNIEIILTSLRNEKEVKELEEFKRKLEEDVNWSIKEKTVQSDLKKERIKNEHQKRVQEYEQKHEEELEERRKLYEEAFIEEKNKYLANL